MNIIEKIRRWRLNGTLDKALANTATSKGHKHTVGKIFKSINHSGISPAEYRNSHSVMRNGRLYKRGKKKKKQGGK